jgi:hypothetical protein
VLALPSERGHASCNNGSAAVALSGAPGAPEQCVFKLVTPAAAAGAARHFGCPAAQLLGPELENQDTTVGATYGSHWEMRLFAGEVMAPILLFDDMFVSEATLGFFEDSGWYRPNYDVADAARVRGRGREGLACAAR